MNRRKYLAIGVAAVGTALIISLMPTSIRTYIWTCVYLAGLLLGMVLLVGHGIWEPNKWAVITGIAIFSASSYQIYQSL